MIDLWQLHIFCKVVENKSFSKAGKAARLSQPTVSSHIKDLEEHFECRLIDRLSKEASPTKAGRLLYGYAKRLMALKAETESAMAEFQGAVKGNLTMGGSTIPGEYILPGIIGEFTKQYPGVRISLVIGDTENIINGVLSGELEVGVVGAKTTLKNVVQTKLVADEMCLVVPGDHKWAGKKRIPLDRIFSEPFILRESGSGTLKSIGKSFAQKGARLEDLNTVARIGSTKGVAQGIKSRLGLSILSPIAVKEDVKNKVLATLTIDGLDLKRNFYLTRHKGRSDAPLCSAFVDFIKEWSREEENRLSFS